jgi:hypothetical protein
MASRYSTAYIPPRIRRLLDVLLDVLLDFLLDFLLDVLLDVLLDFLLDLERLLDVFLLERDRLRIIYV